MALPALLTAPQTQRINVDLVLCRASAGSGVVVRGRWQAHRQRSAASARVRLQKTMPEGSSQSFRAHLCRTMLWLGNLSMYCRMRQRYGHSNRGASQ